MDKILQILADLRPEFDFTAGRNFIDDGYLDSFDVVALVSELEEEFGVLIDGMDILPENFSSLESISRLVQKSGGVLT